MKKTSHGWGVQTPLGLRAAKKERKNKSFSSIMEKGDNSER